MKLITYFQNRLIPIKVKPCFTDTLIVQTAYYYRQFALSLGKGGDKGGVRILLFVEVTQQFCRWLQFLS